MKTFEEIEVVTPRHALAGHDLPAGSIGTIVHAYRDGVAYDAEFVEESGCTKALVTLDSNQLDAWSASEAAE